MSVHGTNGIGLNCYGSNGAGIYAYGNNSDAGLRLRGDVGAHGLQIEGVSPATDINLVNSTGNMPEYIAKGVWEDLLAGGDFGGAGSIGKLLADDIDAAISSRLATTGYTAPLSAAGTRAALGMSAANLDAQLAGIDADVLTRLAATSYVTPPTAVQIAAGVWQDTTGGHFTVPHSIGRALYIDDIAPGASGGIALVGSNMGSVASVTAAVTVGAINANVITAASIAASALNGKGDWLSAAGTRSALGMSAANMDAQLAGIDADVLTRLAATSYVTPPTAVQNAAAVLAAAVEGGMSLEEVLRVVLSSCALKTIGAGTSAFRTRDLADGKDRIVASTDSRGNRTAVTVDGT
jgi:hypothetical protein